MKILNHDLDFWDFIPPVLERSFKKLRALVKLSPDTPVRPFIVQSLESYSQFNEDLLIDLLFSLKKTGFYLDIGANDPSFNNNTKRFYDKGWSGINIDPELESFNKFTTSRPRDINLNIGVAPVKGTLPFYRVVGDSTLSSFNVNIAKKMAAKLGLSVEEIRIEVLRLKDVFESYVKDSKVDFMSVDAEGLDLEILQSNDWNIFRPTLVMVEIDNQYHDIVNYLDRCGYILVFNNYHNGIFIDRTTSEAPLKAIAKVR